MGEFLVTAFTFPTLIFSVLLILVFLYWVLVFLSGTDFDFFSGTIESAADVAEGAVEGLVDGALESAAEAAEAGEAGATISHRLGLAGVPATISASLIVFFGWCFSMGGATMVKQLAGGALGGALGAAVVAFASLLLAVVTTGITLWPLKRAFSAKPATQRRDLVGRTCRVTTQRVDARFGQAEVLDQGTGILIQVRTDEENDFTRGSEALIKGYDPGREVFVIVKPGERVVVE